MEPKCQSHPVSIRCRWWQQRSTKAFVVAFVLILAFYIIEPVIGERLWKGYQKEAATRGLKLQYKEYETPPFPDEENYAAAPIFQRLLEDTEARRALEKQLVLPEMPDKLRKPAAGPLDLTNWQNNFAHNNWIPAESSNPASDVLTGLERMEGPLSEIRAASKRPKARWPTKWTAKMGHHLPPSTALNYIGITFIVRIQALLALDRPDEAMTEMHHAIRLADSFNGSPLITTGRLRNVLWDGILSCIEEGIQANKWKPTHFQQLSEALNGVDLLAEWKTTLNSERCFFNHYMGKWMTTTPSTLATELRGIYILYPESEELIRLGLLIAPRGWVRKNQVDLNKFYDLLVEDIDVPNGTVAPQFDHPDSRLDQYFLTSKSLSRRLAYFSIESFWIPSYKAFRVHVRTRQVAIACALARYRHTHGSFPESLNQLELDHLKVIPHDTMDGKPMRYRRNDDGGCVIWSIGKNRVDDGGIRGEKKRSRTDDLDWTVELPPLTKP